MRVTGIDQQIAARIVENRGEVGGFRSVEEIGALPDVPAPAVDELRPYSVFLPL